MFSPLFILEICVSYTRWQPQVGRKKLYLETVVKGVKLSEAKCPHMKAQENNSHFIREGF